MDGTYVDGLLITAIVTLAGVIATLWLKLQAAQEKATQKIEENTKKLLDMIRKHDAESDTLAKETNDARLVIVQLQAEIKRLGGMIEEMSSNGHGDAVITVDDRGLIREWNEVATLLFHYEKLRAFGKPITMLIPPRYLDRHLEGWSKVIKDGLSPKEGPYSAEAKTADGREVKVSIRLSAFRDQVSGERRISARIRPVLGVDNAHDPAS